MKYAVFNSSLGRIMEIHIIIRVAYSEFAFIFNCSLKSGEIY